MYMHMYVYMYVCMYVCMCNLKLLWQKITNLAFENFYTCFHLNLRYCDKRIPFLCLCVCICTCWKQGCRRDKNGTLKDMFTQDTTVHADTCAHSMATRVLIVSSQLYSRFFVVSLDEACICSCPGSFQCFMDACLDIHTSYLLTFIFKEAPSWILASYVGIAFRLHSYMRECLYMHTITHTIIGPVLSM